MADLPTGIGTNDQATQVTAFIRQQPWYFDWLRQNRIVPRADQQVTLTKQQRQDLAGLAIQHGIGLNHKFDQIDENGQVSEAHHKLKKTLIAAAIGGAALSGFGAAGIGPLAGMMAGSTALGAGAAAIPTTEGIASATALGLPVTAGLGTAGAATAAGAGAAAAGTAAATGGAAAPAAALPVLPAVTTAAPVAAPFGAAGTGILPAAVAAPAAAAAAPAAAAPAAVAPAAVAAPAATAPIPATTGVGPLLGGLSGPTTAAEVPVDLAATGGGGGGGASVLKALSGGNEVNAGISAFTQLYGTKMANDAAKQAAQTTADANKYSADIQLAENKRAELLLRQQNENDWKNAELTRLANYGQWAARERRIGNLGEALGMGQREIPAYMAGIDPNYLDAESLAQLGRSAANTPGAGGPTSTTQVETSKMPYDPSTNPYANDWTPRDPKTGLPITNGSIQQIPGGTTSNGGIAGTGQKPGAPAGTQPQTTGDPIMDALTKNYASLGVAPSGPGSGPTDIAYFAKRIAETGGMTPDNQNYWFGANGRIAQELQKAKSGGSAPAQQAAGMPYQQFQYSPLLTQPLTAALGPGTLGTMAGMK